MPIEIIRCLSDNYAFLIHDPAAGEVTLIDAPEAAPILDVLADRGWNLTRVYLTHHHWDHVDGLAAIVEATGAEVWGHAGDAERLPKLNHAFVPGDELPGGAQVLDAPGHTLGHIALYYPELSALFSADSLMTHGCGRLFEGTPDQMFDTVARFAALPEDTRVYSGHDYAAANLAFAANYAPDAEALAARQAELPILARTGAPTTGTTLESEKLLNPYLRCHLPQVAAAAGVAGADPRAVFAAIRSQKDNA
ncbi:hydroxyacylglutathione hydrolase [Pararhodobacter oceanensis]|uniref:Hydroxyacylglutathione hydrolase n=1 Tax=Pararhodobacter oceanensis TaxID=2172121 RepID=A0A2T8HWL4_9RHOB|nr:hydroxyacylglutathione hydrolase [Pararhodobacter oceanensis]PVH29819.1 hydroxyacylglutathione hydrolase [Pararhodobacter oceanensis]